MNSNFSTISTMRNQHGIEIKMCCASCQHKVCNHDGSRVCSKMRLKVEQQFCCKEWTLAEESFSKAGRSGGKVKRREYLMFVFETRMQEQEAIDKGEMTPDEQATLDSLRRRFEEQTGLSPFYNL